MKSIFEALPIRQTKSQKDTSPNAFDAHKLNGYLPKGAFYLVLPYFERHCITLIVTKARKTILGNYLFEPTQQTHKITINGNLNPYAFLITLLHEIAHLITFEKYAHSVKAHGIEWKVIFKEVLNEFLVKKIFPSDIEQQLHRSIDNLKASSCADLSLAQVLKLYDQWMPEKELIPIQDIRAEERFIFEEKRIFRMIGKVKKRYKCEEISTRRIYLFYALCEVRKMR